MICSPGAYAVLSVWIVASTIPFLQQSLQESSFDSWLPAGFCQEKYDTAFWTQR